MPCLLCVPIVVNDPASALAEAEHARLAGADLVEFRFDTMLHGEDDIPEAVRIVQEVPLPCIATCRLASEGGAYDGPESLRRALYEALCACQCPPRCLDIEYAAFAADPAWRAFADASFAAGDSSILLSTHDFRSRPADLSRRLLAMRDDACRVIKVAFMARSLRDNLELFDMLRDRDRATIALAMGESGLMSRVLAPKFGGFLTFASLRPTSITAPGQPTLAELLGQYRFRSITPKTRVYGVIGWPVAHSLSPAVHNAGFEAAGINAVYLPMPVLADDADAEGSYLSLKATLLAFIEHPHLDFAGASITLPHKVNLVRLAREQGWAVDPAADALGAANTLVVERPGGRVRVLNTDAPAIADTLAHAVGPLDGCAVTILGAGGVGRAAAYACASRGARVTIANRELAKAHRLVDDIRTHVPGELQAVPLDAAQSVPAEIIINATSLGMTGGPDANASPIDLASAPWVRGELSRGNGHKDGQKSGTVVFDTVYRPLLTPILHQARTLGLTTIDGAVMFVRQAVLQFQCWTGLEPSAELYRRIVLERLEQSHE
ncbi:MAG: type I 3-dehydroquinate dehydratase [Phycisphaeraceae bacterium]|nr:type I 3-dehydroquinate dehydratase [Phycisphaeraceae bacterium]MCW5753265.1 type I 3-dehydroquinate dehydratase [Phycisphaeraceae bacterium]